MGGEWGRACMCAPVQSRAGRQRGTTFTPSPCSALTQVGTPQTPGGVWDWDMPGVLAWGSSLGVPQPASLPGPR